MYVEIAIVVALVVINGLLAMSELAVVSSRPARLKALADTGHRGAETAIRLAADAGRFLSTVQIGITLVGVLSGAFSGATLGLRLSLWLESVGLSTSLAEALGVGVVVVSITYLSLIFGELVPKQIALRDPERMAAKVAPAMQILSRVSAPLVWLLSASGKSVLGLLGQSGAKDERVTEEEVKSIIAEAENAGVLERDEREMIGGVMRLADRSARALMTQRRDVEILDLANDPTLIRRQLLETKRSRLPVRDGEVDSIVGVVIAKELSQALAAPTIPDLHAYVHDAPVVLDSSGALSALRAIRASRVHMALVFDEYGHFEGVITAGDVLEAIVGVFHEEGEAQEPALVQREDGSFLVSGWMPIDEFKEKFEIPQAADNDYETVAGYILDRMKRLPAIGETVLEGGWSIEIVDLDGRRIDKVIVKSTQ